MGTLAKGNLAEAAVLEALVSLGASVLIPFGEGHSYDLALAVEPNGLVRVQCKAARERGGCIVFNCRSTDHGRGRLGYGGRADVFGVYYQPADAVFLVPVSECPGFEVNLRHEPARNHQRKRVRLASDYAVERWSLEALARLSRGAPPSRRSARSGARCPSEIR